MLVKQGLRIELIELDSADFCFEGKGPHGPLQVGIERKTLGDLVGSLRSGRLHGRSAEDRSQLDRLHENYDISWLLVEGVWTTDKQGRLLWSKGVRGSRPVPGFYTEDSLAKVLLTLELQAGLRIKQTFTIRQTAAWLASLYHWWTDKEWDKHTTLNATYGRETKVPISRFREVAMRCGIGLAESKAVEEHCGGHLSLMFDMPLKEWAELDVPTTAGPRKLGYAKAERILQIVSHLR